MVDLGSGTGLSTTIWAPLADRVVGIEPSADMRRQAAARTAARGAVTLRNRGSVLVGAGILLSRIAGLVRQRVLAYYLGLGDAADVFAAAFRVPNLLQNLFGEGALSASFIPSYSRLLGGQKNKEQRDIYRGLWKTWINVKCWWSTT